MPAAPSSTPTTSRRVRQWPNGTQPAAAPIRSIRPSPAAFSTAAICVRPMPASAAAHRTSSRSSNTRRWSSRSSTCPPWTCPSPARTRRPRRRPPRPPAPGRPRPALPPIRSLPLPNSSCAVRTGRRSSPRRWCWPSATSPVPSPRSVPAWPHSPNWAAACTCRRACRQRPPSPRWPPVTVSSSGAWG